MGENQKSRDISLDVAKGILIIFVVVGHSYTTGTGFHHVYSRWEDYLYLFHMPAFFIIGGMLNRCTHESIDFFAIRKAKRLLLPYIAYVIFFGIGVYALRVFRHKITGMDILKQLSHIIVGGKYLGDYQIRPLWFLPVYFEVVMAFFLLSRLRKRVSLIVIGFLWMCGHLESIVLTNLGIGNNTHVFLDLDIGLVCLTWYALGTWCKDFIRSKYCELVSALFVSVFFVIRFCTKNYQVLSILQEYGLELAVRYYRFTILDTFIPISMTVVLLWISKMIAGHTVALKLFFIELSKYTIPIMALHIIVNYRLSKILGISTSNETVFILLGVFVPYLFAKVLIDRLPERGKRVLM